MILANEERKKKLISYAEKFPIDDMPGATTLITCDNSYLISSKDALKTMGFNNQDEAYDVKFECIKADSHRNHEQWKKDCEYGIKNNKLVRLISYGKFADGWKIWYGHHKTIVDKETNNVIGIIANYIDMTENSFFDVGRLILMESEGMKRKQFQYRIQDKQEYEGLTTRQQEVYFWYLRGFSSKEISALLSKKGDDISEHTVNTHLSRIRLRLNVSNRAQLLEKAVSIGFMCTVPESLFIN
jgi:DNA-binding CsgD family transcriptional regulator